MGSILSIEPGLMIWTIVSFLIFMLILRKAAWGPIVTALDQRERGIRESIEEAARNREESEKILAEQKEALKQGREEAREVIAEAKNIAAGEGEKILDSARIEGEKLIERAKAEIKAEEQQAIEHVRREAVDIALEAASRLLQKSLDAPDHRRMVEDFISRLGTEKKS